MVMVRMLHASMHSMCIYLLLVATRLVVCPNRVHACSIFVIFHPVFSCHWACLFRFRRVVHLNEGFGGICVYAELIIALRGGEEEGGR